jgi:hypothetical protein
LDSEELANSNGISVSDDGKYLYFASYKNGIRIVDRLTKKIINDPNSDYGGIDGMKFYKNSLVAIVNGKKVRDENGVYRFFLSKGNTAIIGKEKIIPFQENFQIPTTFTIINSYIYFVINSQLDNMDGESNRIIDTTKLKAYQLMKTKLK